MTPNLETDTAPDVRLSLAEGGAMPDPAPSFWQKHIVPAFVGALVTLIISTFLGMVNLVVTVKRLDAG